MPIRLASDQERVSIVGATGSGKTYAALWHLSQANFTERPWIIYDFKVDETIDMIDGAQDWPVTDDPPQQPGIYIVRPLPDDLPQVEAQMWKIWQRGYTGVYIDEGYMIGANNRAFRALLTQGRSKRIPMIILSQRPVWMDRFVFSESEIFQVFRLQNRQDIKKVNEFIPHDLSSRLPEFHSYYYDVKSNAINVLKPVPDRGALLATFERRMIPVREL
jgi:hypothetical protein